MALNEVVCKEHSSFQRNLDEAHKQVMAITGYSGGWKPEERDQFFAAWEVSPVERETGRFDGVRIQYQVAKTPKAEAKPVGGCKKPGIEYEL